MNKTSVKQTMPWGLYCRNGHRVLFSNGTIRACEMSATPDTFFSIPARARIKGKWYRGYVTTEERESDGERIYSFRFMDDQAHGFPEWPKCYTPQRQALLSVA